MKLTSKVLHGCVVLFAFLTVGCSTSAEKNFLTDNGISVERVNSKLAHVERGKVSKTTDGIMIYGVLKRHDHPRRIIPGHVDIEILDSNGQSLDMISRNYSRIPLNKNQSTFRVELSAVPENGSVIRVSHHPK